MKIFIIPHPKNFNFLFHCPRGQEIVRRGLIENGVELTSSYDEADFAILDYVPHDNDNKFTYFTMHKYAAGNKLVCIDWIDEPDQYIYYPERCRAYFKRSYCLPVGNYQQELVTRREKIDNPHVQPFAYCALPEFDLGQNIPLKDRPITIGCYLRPTCQNRWWTLNAVKQIAEQLGVSYHIGPVNDSSRSVGTKCHYDSEYLHYLANTQIIVTSQPSGWLGDSRLWESLLSGALVLTDEMYAKYPNHPMNEKHVLEYGIGNTEDLVSRIKWAINNLGEAQEISDAGKKYTLEYNMPASRMKVVIDHLKGLL